MDCSLPGSSVLGDSPSKDIGVGCHSLLQGIFPTQGSNLHLLHCRQVLYHLSHQGNPWVLDTEQRKYTEQNKQKNRVGPKWRHSRKCFENPTKEITLGRGRHCWNSVRRCLDSTWSKRQAEWAERAAEIIGTGIITGLWAMRSHFGWENFFNLKFFYYS